MKLRTARLLRCAARAALVLTLAVLSGLTRSFALDAPTPAPKPSQDDVPIKHRFLALSTDARCAVHYIDQTKPEAAWTVPGGVRDIALIGDDRVILANFAQPLKILDLRTRRIVAEIPNARGEIQSVQPSPDGRLVVAGRTCAPWVMDLLGRTVHEIPEGMKPTLYLRRDRDGAWTYGTQTHLVVHAPDGSARTRIPIPGARPLCQAVGNEDGAFWVTGGYGRFLGRLNANGEFLSKYQVGPEAGGKAFCAGFQVLSNGHVVAAVWSGHGADDSAKAAHPQIVEVDAAGHEVWRYRDPTRMGSVVQVLVLDGLDTALPHQQISGKQVPTADTNPPALIARLQGNSLDGLALLPDKSLVISMPNLNDRSRPPALALVATNGVCTDLPLPAPGVGSARVVPFGVDAGTDGSLYLADNQFFSEKQPKPASRLLCRRPDGVWRVVADGLAVANGVRVRGEFVYVTDSQRAVQGEGPDARLTSAVFRFPLAGEGIKLGSDALKSPYLVACFQTPIHRDPFGADGIAFDSEGRCLVSFFDLGQLLRFPMEAQGKAGKQEVLIPPGILPSADGLAFDPGSGAVLVADPRSQSIHRWHPEQGLTLLSRRTLGNSEGRLDSPVDLVIRDGRVLVSNWTTVGRGCVISGLLTAADMP